MTIRIDKTLVSLPRRAEQAVAKTAVRSKTYISDSFRAVLPPKKQLLELSLEKLMPKSLGKDRTPGQAVADADLLLRGPEVNNDSEGTAEVTHDAPNVNDSTDTDVKSKRHRAAEKQVEANAALEAERLAKMSPEDQAKYEAVKQRCLDANDPVAALALQKMLFEGKLPGAKDLKGEGTTLDVLAQLSDEKTPLAEGVDRNGLVTDLVQELATPSSINQGPRGTCAPTTIAIQLALEHPAEYARIAAGLASPEGSVTLASGSVLNREDGTAADDGTGRSTVQRMMGSAFMELSNGDEDYDNSTGTGAGAWSDNLDVLYEAVNGKPMSDQRLTTDEQRADAMDTIDAELRAGGVVPVAVEWGGGYHKVLVTGTETIDGKEYVDYINPWGREERIPREDFEKRLADISYDPNKKVIGEVLGGLDDVGGAIGGAIDDLLGALDPADLMAEVKRSRLAQIAA